MRSPKTRRDDPEHALYAQRRGASDLPIFADPSPLTLARVTDPEESHQAAADVVSAGTIAAHEARILKALRADDGGTD